MNPEIKVRLHLWIDGHVQGVGFRAFVLDRAQRRQLTGWVRNTYQGQVEVLAEGSRDQLDGFLDEVRRGPRSAFVTECKVEWENATGEFSRFEVRPTA